jgi:hypothetical protein
MERFVSTNDVNHAVELEKSCGRVTLFIRMNEPKLLNVFQNHSIVLAHLLYSFWSRSLVGANRPLYYLRCIIFSFCLLV